MGYQHHVPGHLGRTALQLAVELAEHAAITLLLDAGAGPTKATTAQPRPPVEVAYWNCDCSAALLLLRHSSSSSSSSTYTYDHHDDSQSAGSDDAPSTNQKDGGSSGSLRYTRWSGAERCPPCYIKPGGGDDGGGGGGGGGSGGGGGGGTAKVNVFDAMLKPSEEHSVLPDLCWLEHAGTTGACVWVGVGVGYVWVGMLLSISVSACAWVCGA